jgi:tRNA nucleotidyltransferase (CCA-adding enzyme)
MKTALDLAGDAFPGQEPDAIENRPPEHEWNTPEEYKFVWANGQLQVSEDEDHSTLADNVGLAPNHTGPMAVGHIAVVLGKATFEVETNVHANGLARIFKDFCKQQGWRWGGMTDIQGEPVGTGSEFAPVKSMAFSYRNNHLYISKTASKGQGAIHIEGSKADVRPLKPEWFEAVKEWADDSGLTLVGANDNVLKRIEDLEQDNNYSPEWNDEQDHFLFQDPPDERKPGGVFKCPECSRIFTNWGLYTQHRREEDPEGDPLQEDSHFPEMDMDATFPPHFQEQYNVYEAAVDHNTYVHQLEPIAQAYERAPIYDPQAVGAWRELADDSVRRAAELRNQYNITETDDPEPYANAHEMFKDIDRGNFVVSRANSDHPVWTPDENVAFRCVHDLMGHYPSKGDFSWAGENAACAPHFDLLQPNAKRALLSECIGQTAYANYNKGFGPQKMATIPEFEQHFSAAHEMPEGGFCHRHLRHGIYRHHTAAQKPKDMIPGPIPFIYDIKNDQIIVGDPGTQPDQIQGTFTPGGIVTGTYEPGGKVLINSATNMPFTVRHMLELWYYTQPALEVSSVHMVDQDGGNTKLAGSPDIGAFLIGRVAADGPAWKASQALHKAGGRVYVVGGAVRDALLGKEPKDIDLMVTGLDENAIREALKVLPGGVDLTGKDFGVFRYKEKGGDVEIALPRTERSTGVLNQDFHVNADPNLAPEQDLYRRDFTANAMAVDLDTGDLIDPYGGLEDIQNKRLRTLNTKSLGDDPLRTMRALTAVSRHGLYPDDETKEQISKYGPGLLNLPKERIQGELDKIFAGKDPAAAMELANETGLQQHIFPEVHATKDYDQNNPHHELILGDHLTNVLRRTSQVSDDPDLRLAAYLHDIGKPASAWTDPVTGKNHYYQGPNGEGADHEKVGADMAENRLTELNYPAARVKRVRDLIYHHMYPAFNSGKGARRFLNTVGPHADALMTLRWADQGGKAVHPRGDEGGNVNQQRALVEQARQQNAPTQRSQLAINGNDLLEVGIPAGPQVGRILNLLTEAVVENPELNTPDALRGLALRYR